MVADTFLPVRQLRCASELLGKMDMAVALPCCRMAFTVHAFKCQSFCRPAAWPGCTYKGITEVSHQAQGCLSLGVIHLFSAVTSLWTLGKFLEYSNSLFAPWLTVPLLFLIPGISGAVASTSLAFDYDSAGATAGVCGLLGDHFDAHALLVKSVTCQDNRLSNLSIAAKPLMLSFSAIRMHLT